MAEAPANSSHGGYEDDFVDAVEEDLKCIICQCPLRDQILTKCGHRFCNKCLDTYFTRLEREGQRLQCPVDRGNLSRDKADVFPDRATERKILSFAVKCPSEGCQWTGELRSKSNHLESCPLKVTSCTNQNCDVIMVRRDLQEHVNVTCDWRILQCSYCYMAPPACKAKDHQAECRRYLVKCPQSCNGDDIPREEIEDHIEKECPLTMISCPYADMGCTTKIQRRGYQGHLKSSMRRHLHLVCLKLKQKKTRLDKTEEKVEVLENRLRQLSTNVSKISNFDTVLKRLDSVHEVTLQSPPFSYHGYKFRLNLKCEIRFPPFVSAKTDFVLMVGVYDPILPWPFRNKVTIAIIDPRRELKTRSNRTVSFEVSTEEDMKQFSRPLHNEKVCCSENILFGTTSDIQRYSVNGNLFIQVDISPFS